MKKRATALRINKVPIILVATSNTFSGPLLLISPAQPDIDVRLRETFLFWIKTTKINKTESITIVNCNESNIN